MKRRRRARRVCMWHVVAAWVLLVAAWMASSPGPLELGRLVNREQSGVAVRVTRGLASVFVASKAPAPGPGIADHRKRSEWKLQLVVAEVQHWQWSGSIKHTWRWLLPSVDQSRSPSGRVLHVRSHLVVPVALLTAGVGYCWWRDRRARPGHCPACGYDLAGLGDGAACPECGRGAQEAHS